MTGNGLKFSSTIILVFYENNGGQESYKRNILRIFFGSDQVNEKRNIHLKPVSRKQRNKHQTAQKGVKVLGPA